MGSWPTGSTSLCRDGASNTGSRGRPVHCRPMRRLLAPALALSLLLAACGGDAAEPDPTTAEDPATTSAPTTAAPDDPTTAVPDDGAGDGETTTTTAPETTTTTSDRPPAPDFTLALGDGGTFTLSEEQKPVYMIFWAEW